MLPAHGTCAPLDHAFRRLSKTFVRELMSFWLDRRSFGISMEDGEGAPSRWPFGSQLEMDSFQMKCHLEVALTKLSNVVV